MSSSSNSIKDVSPSVATTLTSSEFYSLSQTGRELARVLERRGAIRIDFSNTGSDAK